jgi:hypothetical protein
MSEVMIEISEKEHQELVSDQILLQCLQAAGVDSWEGYDQAIEMMMTMEDE